MTARYSINDIFYSIQGEGRYVGHPAVFVRFAGCNMTCSFCDTDFEERFQMTAREIVAKVAFFMPRPRFVILTGGEPLIQYDDELYDVLKAHCARVACETNGSVTPRAKLDYIAVSPKVSEETLAQVYGSYQGVDELRYTVRVGMAMPAPRLRAKHYYLSPINDGPVVNKENLAYAIGLCKRNPTWKLSFQAHKLLGVD